MSTIKGETDCGSGCSQPQSIGTDTHVHRLWTKDDEEYLLSMHRTISKELNRSDGAIAQKLAKLLKSEEEKKKKQEQEAIKASLLKAEEEKKKLTCSICQKTFDSAKGLKIHTGRIHKTPKQEMNKKKGDKEKKKDAKEKKKDKEKKKKSTKKTKTDKEKKKNTKKKRKEKKQKKNKNTKSNDKNTNTNTNRITIELNPVHNTIGIQQDLEEDEIQEPPKKKQKRNNKQDWSVDEVADWVQGLGGHYAKYADEFKASLIDGTIMSTEDIDYNIVPSGTHRAVLKRQWTKL